MKWQVRWTPLSLTASLLQQWNINSWTSLINLVELHCIMRAVEAPLSAVCCLHRSVHYSLSPPVHTARWAHMRRFLSVCLSVCLWLSAVCYLHGSVHYSFVFFHWGGSKIMHHGFLFHSTLGGITILYTVSICSPNKDRAGAIRVFPWVLGLGHFRKPINATFF